MYAGNKFLKRKVRQWVGVVLLFISFLPTRAQDHTPASYMPPDLSFYQLRGPVAQFRQTASVAEHIDISYWQGLISGADSLKELIVHFDSTGKVRYRRELPLSSTQKSSEKGAEYFYHYNSGQMVSQTVKKDGRLTDSITFDYDRRQRINSYRVYNGKDKLQYKYTFTYNGQDQLITIRRKNEENFPVGMIKLKYDHDGELAEQQFFDDNMRKTETVAFNSRLSDSTGWYHESVLTYGPDGQLISGKVNVRAPEGHMLESSTIDSTRKVTCYRTFRYDDRNNVEEERRFSDMENITASYKYKYDEHGNWVEKATSVNGDVVMITNRELEYL